MTKPFPYQIKGINKISDFGGRALLADEMGLGKSFQSLMYADLHNQWPVVVVCPASIKWNWERECSIHLNVRAEVLNGTKPPKSQLLESPPVVIINYDILKPWRHFLRRLKPKLIVVDECQYIKSGRALRTKMIRHIAKGVPRVLCLSGTPLTNRPIELFSSLHLLRPDIYASRRAFGFQYCKPTMTPFGWEFNGASNIDQLHKLLKSSCMIRRLKKDVLKQLPDKSRNIVPLQVSKRSEYEKASHDLISWLRSISKSKAIRAARAQQMVKAGYLKRLAAELKMKAVFEWIDNFLEGSTDKIILFAIHRNIIKMLLDKYKGLATVIDGSIKGKQRQHNIDKFQTDKRTRIMVAQLQAGGVGWNGTAASTVAFVELGWIPAEHIQAEDRTHRIGQKKKCTAYYLVAKDTIEERLCKIIREKQAIIKATLDGTEVGEDFGAFDALISELRSKGRK
jgi:SWI/SNF-related matrix-associated actin-dependent regulator of chromatin subfamily A-like protein 1